MEIKDILFLVIAIVAWIFSSYRAFRKQQAANEKKKTIPGIPPASPPVKPVYVKMKKPAPSGSLEKVQTDITSRQTAAEKTWIANQQQATEKIFKDENPANNQVKEEWLEEIYSGKTDWRKAIILSEIVKPVHF